MGHLWAKWRANAAMGDVDAGQLEVRSLATTLLKTVVARVTVGSNPTPTARRNGP